MSALTADQIAQLRRMVAEHTATTYSDATLDAYVARYPIPDSKGYSQGDRSGILDNSISNVNTGLWAPTYDLNAAASEIWGEKAALVAGDTDFTADGTTMTRSQKIQHANKMATYYNSRRNVASVSKTGMSMTPYIRETQRALFLSDGIEEEMEVIQEAAEDD